MSEPSAGGGDAGPRLAGGASGAAEPAEAESPSARGSAHSRGRRVLFWDWLLLLPLLGVLATDQLSKQVVRSSLDLYEAWPSEGFFRLVHRTNTGSAFGLFPGQTVMLVVLSVFAIGFLYYFYRTQALSNPFLRVAIGLQLGGALGNLIDRLRSGAVVDFVDVGPWPTFNLADSSIVVGILLLVVALAFMGEAEKKRPGPDGRVEAAD